MKLLARASAVAMAASLYLACTAVQAQDQERPNILVIWGDDIGQSNISAYTKGLVGYRTPNIDRIASEGMIFTDYYAEQSCTAGRASFIMGQSVFRTGLSKVGLPGAALGMREEEPTIAGLLKAEGYATGQFGKNHLGDRDEHLPTNHGFDEFFGNLYHLNAEEEPENEDYPGDMVLANGKTFREQFGPRGVIHSFANPDGTQRIEDTGPLTKKRMETVDDDTSDAAVGFIKKAAGADQPFFVWWNGSRMHFRTHVKDELRGISGQDEYADGMVEHDRHVGKLLKALDDLGIADNTIVFYSTDNGPHYNTWPDAGATPFRGEKNTNWEGGWRVPAAVRWPGHIEAGSVSNQIMHHMDWLPTFLAAAPRGPENQSYEITFASGQEPPVNGFWSLTLYNEHHFFHPNDIGRYSLGTKNKDLIRNADGSLTIYAGAKSPGTDKEANWLPAPDGAFSLYIRSYWGKEAILDGSWQPPKIVAAN